MSANVEDKKTRITGGTIVVDILFFSPFIFTDQVSNYVSILNQLIFNKQRRLISAELML